MKNKKFYWLLLITAVAAFVAFKNLKKEPWEKLEVMTDEEIENVISTTNTDFDLLVIPDSLTDKEEIRNIISLQDSMKKYRELVEQVKSELPDLNNQNYSENEVMLKYKDLHIKLSQTFETNKNSKNIFFDLLMYYNPDKKSPFASDINNFTDKQERCNEITDRCHNEFGIILNKLNKKDINKKELKKVLETYVHLKSLWVNIEASYDLFKDEIDLLNRFMVIETE